MEALHLAYVALKAAEPVMTKTNIRRWAMIWLPYMALIEATVRRAQQGHVQCVVAERCSLRRA